MNSSFTSNSRFGYIAAAGDRHMAEFMDNDEYLASPETVKHRTFGLTAVQWRKEDLVRRLERSARLMSGEEAYQLRNTGEEAVRQIRAILDVGETVANVNLPIAPLQKPMLSSAKALCSLCLQDRENDDILDAAFSGSLSFAYEKFRNLNMLKKLTEEQKKAFPYSTLVE